MLSSQAWRAARLVVDTGIHVFGWTRQEAIDYMTAHTAEGRAQIEIEVDRYIILPGQTTAYMIGSQEIQRLRARAKTALGEDFDVAAFHDVILGDGAVTLPMLAEKVERWLAARRSWHEGHGMKKAAELMEKAANWNASPRFLPHHRAKQAVSAVRRLQRIAILHRMRFSTGCALHSNRLTTANH